MTEIMPVPRNLNFTVLPAESFLPQLFLSGVRRLRGIIGQYYPNRNRTICHNNRGDFMSRLRELRKERGYTQVKMQMLTGIDQSAYSKIERGERYLSFEQCRRVALALDTSMDYLAGLTDEKKPYPRSK